MEPPILTQLHKDAQTKEKLHKGPWHLRETSVLDIVAAAEEAEQHLELDESHRTQALSGVETDTHHRRWD